MFLRILIILLLIPCSLNCFAQLDQRKIDSLSRAIDSSSRVIRLSIDSAKGELDSVMKTGTAITGQEQPNTSMEAKKNRMENTLVFWAAVTILAAGFTGMVMKYGNKM